MLTAIIEFATLSMAALYIADAIAGTHDALVARQKPQAPGTSVPEPKSKKEPKTPEPQDLPDVCIPDEDIQGTSVPGTKSKKAPKPRAPKAPKPKAPKEPKPKAPTIADLRAQAKARGLKGYSKLNKADLLALLAQ